MTTAWIVVFLHQGNVVFLRLMTGIKPKKRKTLEKRIAERIARKKGDVFLRRDFEDLGAYDQVGRGLRCLAAKGRLVRIGYGIYARATVSPLSGKIVPAKPLPALAREALARLNVETAPSEFERAYGEGRTAQVPTGRMVAVKGRISRKIGHDGKFAVFERISRPRAS